MSAFKKQSEVTYTPKTYIKASNGFLVYNTTEDDEDPKLIKRYSEKAKKTFYEVPVTHIEGYITRAEYVSKTLDGGIKIENAEIEIENNGDKVVLQIPFETSKATTLMKRLPNVDIEKPVKITYYKIENAETNKYNEGFSIEQGGKKIPFAYTKENKNGMPEAIKSGRGGTVSWNYQPVYDFLYNVFEDFCDKVKGYNSTHVLDDNLDAEQDEPETPAIPKAETKKSSTPKTRTEDKKATAKGKNKTEETSEDDVNEDMPF